MKTFAYNRRSKFDYNFLEEFEAGLVLKGYEVKSIKTGHISLKGSFVTAKASELFLTNAKIPLYKQAGEIKNYEETRARKILMGRKEIDYLLGKVHAEGLTLVPISVYTKKGKIKLKFALSKGKKQFDKRENIKERQENRRIERAMKRKTNQTRI